MVELTQEDVLALLRRRVSERGSQQEWAVAAGVSPQHLGDVLHGRRPPRGQILVALGVTRIERFVASSPEAQS